MARSNAPARQGQSIFISYRRSDCQPQANGLHDGLVHRLTKARIFMDIDSIPAGVDFEAFIRAEIDSCDVVLVLIGDNWLETSSTGKRRIDEPRDFVRLEIESALANPRVRTIPVLVEGAQMPLADDLPRSIRRLARINAFELDDRRWKSDLDRITRLLESPLSGAQQVPVARPPHPAGPAPVGSAQTFTPPPPPVIPPPRVQYGSPAPWQSPAPRQGHASILHRAETGWIFAALPVPCCGLLNIAPLVRSALIRPTQRRLLLSIGAGLEVLTIASFAMVGTAPTDAEGTPTGFLSNAGVAICMISMLAAVVLGVLFRSPITVSLNIASPAELERKAGVTRDEAERIVAQRDLIGHFSSVSQAIDAAELSRDGASRLRKVGTV